MVSRGHPEATLRARAERACRIQIDHLLSLRRPEGHWEAELEANDTITAEWILLRRLLGRPDPAREAAAGRWLRARQSPEGGWRLHPDDPGDLSTTIECYFALRLLGDAAAAPHLSRARSFVLGQGGLERSRAFTRIHLALAGAWDWDEVPALPPWLVLLPVASGLSIYEMASWARACVVPLTVLADARPTTSLGVRLGELSAGGHADPLDPARGLLQNAILIGDRLLRRAARAGLVPARRASREAARRFLLDHVEPTGDVGGIFPAMAYTHLALGCLGYDADAPVRARILGAIDRFGIEDERGFRVQSCVSPVWDTALVAHALLAAGLSPDHPALVRAADWLLDKEIDCHGDWARKAVRGTRPGGWSFEHTNRQYPDLDDSAAVAMLLRQLRPQDAAARAAAARAVDWILGMQSRSGGWAAFDRNNTRAFWNAIPFADHGAMLDPPTADITGRALALLGQVGFGREHRVVGRALGFLARAQEPDGAWRGRWGVDTLYGTSIVLGGLRAVGVPEDDPQVVRAAAFLARAQNPDGGFGESCRSYQAAPARVFAASVPSQTAWALDGLVAAGLGTHPIARRAVDWLCRTQRPQGGWDEEAFTGTGFPRHFYLRYHLYRDHFPLAALGRWLSAATVAV